MSDLLNEGKPLLEVGGADVGMCLCFGKAFKVKVKEKKYNSQKNVKNCYINKGEISDKPSPVWSYISQMFCSDSLNICLW